MINIKTVYTYINNSRNSLIDDDLTQNLTQLMMALSLKLDII